MTRHADMRLVAPVRRHAARDPICTCRCGGENHGTNLLVRVTVDAGAVPILQPLSAAAAERARAQVAKFTTARTDLLSALDVLLARRRRGEFLPRPEFDRLRALQHANQRATTLKTHAARMKTLRAALAA